MYLYLSGVLGISIQAFRYGQLDRELCLAWPEWGMSQKVCYELSLSFPINLCEKGS